MSERRTAYVWDEWCFWHDPGNYALMAKPGGFIEPYGRHIENPDPKRRLHNLLVASGLASQFIHLPARDATDQELRLIHTCAHVEKATDAIFTGQADVAYALTRPPGHHAEPDRAMGFCVFANAALAMQHAIETWGVLRGAIVDWDVHFGNGTYAAFASRPDVFAISIHQQGGYSQVSGEVDEIGSGAGRIKRSNASR